MLSVSVISRSHFFARSSKQLNLHSHSHSHSHSRPRRLLARRFKATLEKEAEAPANANANAVETKTSQKSSIPVGASLLAAFAGITTVSAVSAAVEYATASSCLPYSAYGQRYNQDEFLGRFCRMLLGCDPRLLLYTEDQVRQAQVLLERADSGSDSDSYADDLDPDPDHHRTGTGTGTMDRSLWEARRIADAALHPDTKELIPRPFRMSGYVPYNGPIGVAMVASTSTMPLLLWSWVNQSQNALLNYYNRNASSPMENETLVKSYSIAVGSALAVAFGLATFVQKRYPAEKAKQLMKFVAFPSAVVASSLNCYIVRSPEMETGVPLMDDQGQSVLPGETSQEAAKRGVHSTTFSRALLQAPVYFFPPLLLALGPFQRLMTKHPTIRVPLTTYVLLTSFGLGLPATVAIFPQIVSITPDQVEAKFQHLQDPKTQKPYTKYYYNKGL